MSSLVRVPYSSLAYLTARSKPQAGITKLPFLTAEVNFSERSIVGVHTEYVVFESPSIRTKRYLNNMMDPVSACFFPYLLTSLALACQLF